MAINEKKKFFYKLYKYTTKWKKSKIEHLNSERKINNKNILNSKFFLFFMRKRNTLEISIILFSFILTSRQLLWPSSSNNSIKLIIEVTRHGARSPLYDNFISSVWNIPPGHLTSIGQRQHYLLGRELRRRYMIEKNFLNHSYNDEEVKVYSTDYIRTIQSAQSQLLGLYYDEGSLFNNSKMDKKFVVPPINVENWENILNDLKNNTLPFRFQPIPIKALPDKFNLILAPDENCNKIQQIKDENYQTDYYQNFEKKLHNMGFYRQFEKIFKVDASNLTIEETQQYLDIITMNRYDSRKLPENYTEEFDDLMNFAYCFRQSYLKIGNDSVLPYYVSNFFENLLEKFDEKILNSENENDKLKLEFFSAHDNNLLYILRGLGLTNYTDDFEEFMKPTKFFSYRNPQLASLLLFELHELKENYFVKVLFNDKVMKINDCEEFCSYPKFKIWLKERVLQNWEEKCSNDKKKNHLHFLDKIN